MMKEENDTYDDDNEDLIYKDDPIHGNAKNYIEETFISEKELIYTLNEIFDNNAIWDLPYQTSWCKT